MQAMTTVLEDGVQIKATFSIRSEKTRRKSTKTAVFVVVGAGGDKEVAHRMIRESLEAKYGEFFVDFTPATMRTMNVYAVHPPVPAVKRGRRGGTPRIPRSIDNPALPTAHDTTIEPFRPPGKTSDGKIMRNRYRVVCTACKTSAVAVDKSSAEIMLARHNQKPVRR